MIYLDNAATSWPKPRQVVDAVHRWFEEIGVSADRGDSELCREVAETVDDTRATLARSCGVPIHRVAFTSGATEALNLSFRGLLRNGDRVVTTALEHSSVARPLIHLRESLGLELEVIPATIDGRVDLERIENALRSEPTRLLVFSHASNVLGTVLDAAGLCHNARTHGCLTLLDASQTAGLLQLDVGADIVVASTHKSLLGPPGLGFLAVREGVELIATKQGGTGTSSALDRHPEAWPTAFEAGTPNTPAIFGLHAALNWATTAAIDSLQHGLDLTNALREQLGSREDYTVLGDPSGPRIPVLSFISSSIDPAELGIVLAEAGFHVRTGFHCAPWIHESLGTTRSGTVRVSPGPFTSPENIARLCDAL